MISVSPSLSLLFWTFLKIGSTAFGGLMSLIAVVENVVVEQMELLNHEDILDGISLTTFLPGPISTNVVVYVGYRIRGTLGALVSLSGVIVPSFCLITGLAVFYFQFGQIPQINQLFLGFIPAVMAIITSTAYQMSLKIIKDWRQLAIVVISASLLIGVGGIYLTLCLILASGWLGWFLFRPNTAISNELKLKHLINLRLISSYLKQIKLNLVFSCLSIGILFFFIAKKFTIIYLFLTFAFISLMLFGGAYVGIPLIQEIIVNNRHWLTPQQFAYGIVLGQITPGPIVMSAAFIGYKIQGLLGALVATIGIFLPPFFLMISFTKILESCKHSVSMQAAMKGIRPAVIGMIFAAAWIVSQTASQNSLSAIIFSLSLLVLLRWRINVMWLILNAGIAGLLLY
jgi:chromate transporter